MTDAADSRTTAFATTPGPPAWRFGGYLLEPAKHQLSGLRGPVQVEPQVLELLTYLLTHRDRVVTKDELIGTVWNGRHVTDAAISAGIKKARAVVGDDASRPRVIATVYGRGYRFVAEVEPVDTSEGAVDGARTGGVADERTGIGGRRWGWLALAVAVLAALAILAARQVEVHRPSRLAIVSTDDAIGDVAHDLRQSLAAAPGINLVTGRRDADAVLTATRDAGPSADVDRLLIDLVERTGGGVERPVRLVDQPLPRSDPDRRREGARNAVLRARALTLASLDRGRTPTAARAEARRLVLDALGSWRVSCRDRELLGLLEHAVDLDPGFAKGWYALALTRASVGQLCVEWHANLPRVNAALDRARRLAPDWIEPLQLEVGLLARAGREARASTLLLDGLAREPDHFFLRVRAAEMLRYAGQLERSKAILDDLERRHPGALALTDTVPYPDLYLADWQGFLDRASLRDSSYFGYYRAFALWRLGQTGPAVDLLREAARFDPSDAFAPLAQALEAVLTGRLDEARAVLEQVERRRLAEGPADGEMTYKLGQLWLLAGDPDRALRTLDRTLAEGFACSACLRRDPVWSTLAGDVTFEATVERTRSREAAFAARWLPRIDAALDG